MAKCNSFFYQRRKLTKRQKKRHGPMHSVSESDWKLAPLSKSRRDGSLRKITKREERLLWSIAFIIFNGVSSIKSQEVLFNSREKKTFIPNLKSVSIEHLTRFYVMQSSNLFRKFNAFHNFLQFHVSGAPCARCTCTDISHYILEFKNANVEKRSTRSSCSRREKKATIDQLFRFSSVPAAVHACITLTEK